MISNLSRNLKPNRERSRVFFWHFTYWYSNILVTKIRSGSWKYRLILTIFCPRGHKKGARKLVCAKAAFMPATSTGNESTRRRCAQLTRAGSSGRLSICQFIVIMEAYQSEFCGEDEFYNILETISPFAATMNEVEFCPRCKSAPCTCMKVAGFNFKKSTGTISNKKR